MATKLEGVGRPGHLKKYLVCGFPNQPVGPAEVKPVGPRTRESANSSWAQSLASRIAPPEPARNPLVLSVQEVVVEVVTYYIKCVTTSWTYSIIVKSKYYVHCLEAYIW